jgi:predicted dehydrogenase
MQVEPDNIRVHLSLGGGPLEDIGIYCLNAARYIFKAEPEEVTAFAVRSKDRRFKEVPEAYLRYCNKLWIGSFQAAFTWGLIPSMN